MAGSNSVPHSNISEVAGSFLQILIESFCQTGAVLPLQVSAKTGEIEATQWYSQSKLIDILKTMDQFGAGSKNILFQAGIRLSRIWKNTSSSSHTIQSGLDWLNQFAQHQGYNSVFRGNHRDETGWCDLQKMDVEAGFASFESTAPLPPGYLEGLFYGGCTMFNDMDYVDVSTISPGALPNETFNSAVITVKFRPKTQGSLQDIDTWLSRLSGSPLSAAAQMFTKTEIESLIWRYKNLQIKNRLQTAYADEIAGLLATAISANQQTAELLAQSTAEMIAQRDTIARLANHDPVTGLASLRLGRDRLRMACHTAKRTKTKAAVMCIDLDGFKLANHQHGHAVGDIILKTIAERMSKSIRGTDSAVRQGGDNFLVILSNFSEVDALTIVATRMILAISEPIQHHDILINISSKIGISVYPDDADAPEYLLKNADKAMRSLKNSAKNQYAFYSPDLQN